MENRKSHMKNLIVIWVTELKSVVCFKNKFWLGSVGIVVIKYYFACWDEIWTTKSKSFKKYCLSIETEVSIGNA